jgi:hypothetical protein
MLQEGRENAASTQGGGAGQSVVQGLLQIQSHAVVQGGVDVHRLEQLKNNRIFRPEQIYVGKHDVHYVPLEQRP